MAERVAGQLSQCAQSQGQTISQIYSQGTNSNCPEETKTSLNSLRDNVAGFASSSFADRDPVAQTYKAHPLILQILFEEMTDLSLEKHTVKGGSRGVGICTSAISIGFCRSTPEVREPEPVSEQAARFLRFLENLDVSTCEWGLWPSASVKMALEILNNHRRSLSMYVQSVGNSTVFMSPHLARQAGFLRDSEAEQILINKIKTFQGYCQQNLYQGSGFEFIQNVKLKFENKKETRPGRSSGYELLSNSYSSP